MKSTQVTTSWGQTFNLVGDPNQSQTNIDMLARQAGLGPQRDRPVAGCEMCKEKGIRPPHYASINCQSGGRAHCTCDTCF